MAMGLSGASFTNQVRPPPFNPFPALFPRCVAPEAKRLKVERVGWASPRLGAADRACWGAQASKASRVRRAAAIGAVLVALVALATLALAGQGAGSSRVRVELSDRNEFESSPAYDAAWDMQDIQHHLVRTQRKQTVHNRRFEDHIARLDTDFEDLMKLAKKPGPGGPAGEAGETGPAGPAGESGLQGPQGGPVRASPTPLTSLPPSLPTILSPTVSSYLPSHPVEFGALFLPAAECARTSIRHAATHSRNPVQGYLAHKKTPTPLGPP